MRKRIYSLLAALVCLNGCAAEKRPVKTWAVYYDHKLPAETFKNMDLVVFDRRHYPRFESLKGSNTKVLAYISIGQVYDDVPERLMLQKKHLLLSPDTLWKSHTVDITAPEWHELVLEYVADAEEKGFDGVMLDTIDSPLYWAESKVPDQLPEMREKAAALIRTIRTTFPSMKIMLNRGFLLLPMVASDLDYVLAESIMVDTDVSARQFSLFPPNTYAEAVTQLHETVAFAPHLQVMTLDYWDPDDGNGLEKIYATQRQQGFVPYVTTPDLRRFTPPPRAE